MDGLVFCSTFVLFIDVLAKIEYTYTYENGRIVRAAESAITLSGEIITAKNLENSILYSYDAKGKLIKKRIIPVDGNEQVIYYENPENESVVVKFKAGGKDVTSHSKTDSFGRKVFDELQRRRGYRGAQGYCKAQIQSYNTACEPDRAFRR